VAPVVVIGSGPIGAAVARRLAERGRQTVLLEAGGAVALADRSGARSGEHLRNQAVYRQVPDAFMLEALSHCRFYDPSAPPEGLPGACETVAFGGQGILWTNNCPRTQAGIDRWPALDDPTWERRYADAEALLHVRTDQFEGSQRQRRVAARLARHLVETGATDRRVASLPLAGRPDGNGGIHFTATADVLVDLGAADARLTIRSGTRALRIEHRSGRVAAVRVQSGGGEARVDADAIVVAAGAFATPRLLYASDIRSPALGRWLHYHPLLYAQLILAEALSAPPGAADPPPRLWIPPSRATPWHAMVLRDVGAGAPQEPADERRLIELQFFAPVEPREAHHMSLDDATPRFTVRLTEPDHALRAAMHADLLAIGATLGRWRRGCEPSWNPCGFSHPMGTTRMGDDPATSVVDRTGRVHGMENLYLAGVGLIPVPIAINPTLTAVALALETAEHIAAALGPRAARPLPA